MNFVVGKKYKRTHPNFVYEYRGLVDDLLVFKVKHLEGFAHPELVSVLYADEFSVARPTTVKVGQVWAYEISTEVIYEVIAIHEAMAWVKTPHSYTTICVKNILENCAFVSDDPLS